MVISESVCLYEGRRKLFQTSVRQYKSVTFFKVDRRMLSIFWTTNAPEYKIVSSKVVIFLLVILSLTILFPREGYTGSTPRYLYLVPEGYLGYAQVNFNVERAAPLLREGEYLLIKIPSSGIVNTSSAMIETTKFPYQRDVFFYYSVSGDRMPTTFQGHNT